MANDKIEVHDYLDEHSVTHNSIIEVFSIKESQKAFPEMDQLTLKDFETEWRTARQKMLNLKFGSKW